MFNEFDSERLEYIYSNAPGAKTLTVKASGNTYKGFFDQSFKPGERNPSNKMQQQNKYYHFHIPFSKYNAELKSRVEVSIDSIDYTIVQIERNREIGVFEIWLS